MITPGGIFGDIVPIEIRETMRHDAGDENNGGRRCVRRNGCRERREEQGEDEQAGGGDGRQPGPAAGADPRRAFDIAGGRRGADQGAHHRRRAVGDQGRPARRGRLPCESSILA